MPDLPPDETLHQIWEAAGVKEWGGDIPSPLLWQELQAYATMTGTKLEAEEWQIVRQMSEAYCAELRNRNAFAVSPLDKVNEHD